MGRILGSLLPAALLIGSALCMGVVSLTLSHTSRVRVHKGRSVTLTCMNTTHAGVVQYWHTPFGQVQNSNLHANQKDVISMQRDSSLRIHMASSHHSGLYYCLLLAGGQTTLTPYLLTASSSQDHAVKHRRAVRSILGGHAEERNVAVVSDGVFAAAVAASVVVTFLVGFSSGALSRTLLDRCVNWMRSLGQERRNHGETVSVAFRKDVEQEDEDYPASTTSVTMENVSPSPPAKPQRSFRGKHHEETAYLEGCYQGRGEEGRRESEEGRTECKETESDGKIEEGGFRGDSSSDSEEGSVGVREGGVERQGSAGEERCCPPRPARQSRVIRLYQYDEEGHRYSHLPNPVPMECTSPAPQAKQRSLSLTRLNTIMAAATASPMDPQNSLGRDSDPQDSDPEERDTANPASPSQGQERPVFQLEI